MAVIHHSARRRAARSCLAGVVALASATLASASERAEAAEPASRAPSDPLQATSYVVLGTEVAATAVGASMVVGGGLGLPP